VACLAKSSVKCVRDIRDVGPQYYRLASDGKKWLHVCRQRQQLALWLATFADGDGSSITTGTKRMENALFLSRRTLFRLLDDLRALGFLNGGTLTGYQGTRRRELNVAAILAAPSVVPRWLVPNTDVPDSDARVPDTPLTDVPDSVSSSATYVDQECQIAPQECQIVPPVVPKTADFDTEPSCLTGTQTVTPNRQPAKPASAPENGANEKAAGRLASGVTERGRERKAPDQKTRWLQFIKDAGENLPESMRYATPKPEEIDAILAQLDRVRNVELFADEISEWEESQSPPLISLLYGRWTRWLEQSESLVESLVDYLRRYPNG
jgi:hypothetical protein